MNQYCLKKVNYLNYCEFKFLIIMNFKNSYNLYGFQFQLLFEHESVLYQMLQQSLIIYFVNNILHK